MRTKSKIPHWQFVCTDDQTWIWRCADIVADPLPSIEEAMADAIVACGFDPASDYWTVTTDGRTTHNRPGKPPVKTPAGEEPND